jgi:predicted house-cleaning noncanonical NTP pyrophosphatase (MazG superfamily)
VLGHAYYRLRGAGITVIVPQPKYPRARGRQRHFKIVRDAIAAKGERVSVARLPPDEAFVALIGKLFEEGLELNAAIREEDRLEELADVLEVIRGLAANAGVGWETLVDTALLKRSKRGGFEQQTVLLETERPKPNAVGTLEMSDGGTDPAIQLRDLGLMAVEGSAAAISFSRLLANKSMTVELALGGRTIQLSMALEGGGIQVQIAEGHSSEEALDPQLELFPRN